MWSICAGVAIPVESTSVFQRVYQGGVEPTAQHLQIRSWHGFPPGFDECEGGRITLATKCPDGLFWPGHWTGYPVGKTTAALLQKVSDFVDMKGLMFMVSIFTVKSTSD